MRAGCARLRLIAVVIAVVIEEKEFGEIHVSFSTFRRRVSSNETWPFRPRSSGHWPLQNEATLPPDGSTRL
jgi:hypothetical protein